MSDIKGCIFDLDGVLVETSHFHYLAWSRLGKELGVEVDEQINEQLKGVSRRKSLEVILDLGNIELDESKMVALETKKNAWYLEYLEDMSAKDALPMVVPFLNELRDNSIELAVGSSSKNAVTILKKLELYDYFKIVIDGNAVTEAKPNPEIFYKAAEGLNLEPEQCVVFEDAFSGVEAAKTGNFKCIGIGLEENLGAADFVIPSFENFNLDQMVSSYLTPTL